MLLFSFCTKLHRIIQSPDSQIGQDTHRREEPCIHLSCGSEKSEEQLMHKHWPEKKYLLKIFLKILFMWMGTAARNIWNKTNRTGLFTQGQKLLKPSKISLKKEFFRTSEKPKPLYRVQRTTRVPFHSKGVIFGGGKLFHVHLRPSWQAHYKLHHPTAFSCSAQSMSGGNIKNYSKILFGKDENNKALEVFHSYYH